VIIKLASSTGLPWVKDPSTAGPPGTDPAAIGPARAKFEKQLSVMHAMIAAVHSERRGADMQKPPCKKNRRYLAKLSNEPPSPPPKCGNWGG
jgi:hypothetical protein